MDSEQEKEASWLSGVLLVPAHVALRIARLGMSVHKAAQAYGVSGRLMEWRLNASGARKRVQRENTP